MHRQDKALLAAERGIATIKKTKWSIIVLSIVSMARVRQALLAGRRRCWQTPAQQRYALTRCAAGVHHAILQLHAISTRARSSDLTLPQTSHAGATQSGRAGICKAPACGARDEASAIKWLRGSCCMARPGQLTSCARDPIAGPHHSTVHHSNSNHAGGKGKHTHAAESWPPVCCGRSE